MIKVIATQLKICIYKDKYLSSHVIDNGFVLFLWCRHTK